MKAHKFIVVLILTIAIVAITATTAMAYPLYREPNLGRYYKLSAFSSQGYIAVYPLEPGFEHRAATVYYRIGSKIYQIGLPFEHITAVKLTKGPKRPVAKFWKVDGELYATVRARKGIPIFDYEDWDENGPWLP